MVSGETPFDCVEIRERLHALRRGRLAPADADAVVRHLRGCASCASEDAAEALLDRLLRERLPAEEPSPELRRRLAALVEGSTSAGGGVLRLRPPRPERARLLRRGAGALAAAAALVVAGVGWQRLGTSAPRDAVAQLAAEAVSDHLRVLSSAHPHDLESSATHEVKPWFEGRLDFAPSVPGDSGELRLRGGSVGYFLDRKAAILSYSLRRHVVTLIAVPAAGLGWPGREAGADAAPAATTLRGMHVFFWTQGDLGYALVADVNVAELSRIAAELDRATAR